jgi:acetate kinase
MNVLVPNLGSTSLKYQLIDMAGERVLARGRIERIGGQGGPATHREAIEQGLDHIAKTSSGARIDAVGFKAVHGGPRYRGSFQVSDDLLDAMREFLPVAPLHNAVYIGAMENFRDLLPAVPMVAVFEPGFHATMPDYASMYGVPHEWAERYGVRRYGFHGSSHRYIAGRIPELIGRPSHGLRLVSCHLGGSSSICAIRDGVSIDNSFGFSPQAGVEHAARCGDVDVFAVLYVMEREGLTAAAAGEALSRTGGLLGLSGVSTDMRDIEDAAEQGNARAALAFDVLTYQVKKYIGAYAAAMGGLDAIAFAGGIGENSWKVREASCRDLGFLGVELDADANRQPSTSDRIISTPSARVAIGVVYTNEEVVVARETVRVLAGSGLQ